MHMIAAIRASNDIAAPDGDAADRPERRTEQRRSLKLSAIASSPSAEETRVIIRDISAGGLLIEADLGIMSPDDQLELDLPREGIVRARVVWQSGHFYGCQFSEPVSTGAVSAALLKSEPSLAGILNSTGDPAEATPRVGPPSLEPELNLSVALGLALLLWGCIAAGAYFLFS
ncbi:PilZ domain-containing protein [Parafrankia sp. BMG5.11]|uniref:PilZ domain-containing protein n=1 Tax=Parafrankia sp. BMG5.11 TaxID=222540 RepID=UPI001404C6BF|nr:PilZ domain-containing protein [Parafrankia sp. BMG5.11]